METEINLGVEGARWRWGWKSNPHICISISIYVPPYPTPLSLSHLCLYHRLHLHLAPSPYLHLSRSRYRTSPGSPRLRPAIEIEANMETEINPGVEGRNRDGGGDRILVSVSPSLSTYLSAPRLYPYPHPCLNHHLHLCLAPSPYLPLS